MSLVQISGNASGTGTLTIAAPSTNTNRTLTLPDNTGTLISTGSTFAGTGPTFGATMSATQSVTASTYTQIVFNTEEFDTASCYNNTGATVGGIPAYSFLPNIAGYYQVSSALYPNSAVTGINCSIYKNNVAYKGVSVGSAASSASVSILVYLNGSTDYISIFGLLAGVTPSFLNTGSSGALAYFSAAMVRAA
jgi:hypothetical protein